MLVLRRKPGDRVKIGDHVYVQVLATRKGSVSLGFTAPDDTLIMRTELSDEKPPEEDQAA